jgi:hypothetical protein
MWMDVHPVRIRVEGGSRNDFTRSSDDGLIQRFEGWLREEGVVQVRELGGYVRDGVFLGFFYRGDLQAIRVWLRKNGVVDDDATWEDRA